MVGLVSSHATPCCYRVQGSANCRLEGTYVHEQRKPWLPLMLEAGYKPSGWLGIMCAPSTTAWPCASPSLAHVQPPCVQYVIYSCCFRAGARRLGSRLYFEFTAKALDDSVEWERVADSVAVEVQRHGAPPPSSAAATQAKAESVPQYAEGQVAAVAPAPQSPTGVALAARGAPLAGLGAAVGVSVSSVHNNYITTSTSSNSISNPKAYYSVNTGNTSIVLL